LNLRPLPCEGNAFPLSYLMACAYLLDGQLQILERDDFADLGSGALPMGRSSTLTHTPVAAYLAPKRQISASAVPLPLVECMAVMKPGRATRLHAALVRAVARTGCRRFRKDV
jgi:hypothetical protein